MLQEKREFLINQLIENRKDLRVGEDSILAEEKTTNKIKIIKSKY